MGGGVVLQRKAAGSRVSPMQGACSTRPTTNGSQFQTRAPAWLLIHNSVGSESAGWPPLGLTLAKRRLSQKASRVPSSKASSSLQNLQLKGHRKLGSCSTIWEPTGPAL
jgi:hypothetical protein